MVSYKRMPVLLLSLMFLVLFSTNSSAEGPGKEGYERGPGYHHGVWGMHGRYHGRQHKRWMKSMTKEQKMKYLKLKLAHKKKKILVMLDIKKAKVELMTLLTTNSPDKGKIGKKIDELLALKKKKMNLGVDHKIAVRKILNDEQKLKFDMYLLKKAMKGKGKRRGFHHR